MKKIILLFLAPLFIYSQDYKYEPKKKLSDYEYSPLWTVNDGGEEGVTLLYDLFGDAYFGLSYFGNSFKTNVGISMFEWTFLLPKDFDKEETDNNDVAIILSTSFDYMMDSNAYSFDTPSDELGTGFISINIGFIDKESVTGDRAMGNLSFGWLIFDNDKIFHKGGNVKSFKVMAESKVAGNLWANGGFYFDKDRKTDERHDLPFFGLSYRF
tara:strand:+ start:505 stop:1140 length:636 start_codon:yes stop_codon:yes gene_type:complete